MLHYTELSVKSEHRPKFSFQMSLSWLMHWEREASGILDGCPITWPTEYEKAMNVCFRNWPKTCFTLSEWAGWGRAALLCPVTHREYVRALCFQGLLLCCSSSQPWALPCPSLVWRKRTLLEQERALPESITGHCSREHLASVKPCQGGYKAFLKSSEAISTSLPSCHLKQQQQLLPSQQ